MGDRRTTTTTTEGYELSCVSVCPSVCLLYQAALFVPGSFQFHSVRPLSACRRGKTTLVLPVIPTNKYDQRKNFITAGRALAPLLSAGRICSASAG